MNKKVIKFVRQYVLNHLDKSDATPKFDVYIVWQCYILGNAKWLLSTTLYDGMYYEVTYNATKNEFYLDAYKKFENQCIPNDDAHKPITELSDTADLMISADYKERFKAEYFQNKIRFDKLAAMCEKWDKGELTFTPTCPRDLYARQLDNMQKYLKDLEERAVLEGVDLKSE